MFFSVYVVFKYTHVQSTQFIEFNNEQSQKEGKVYKQPLPVDWKVLSKFVQEMKH